MACAFGSYRSPTTRSPRVSTPISSNEFFREYFGATAPDVAVTRDRTSSVRNDRRRSRRRMRWSSPSRRSRPSVIARVQYADLHRSNTGVRSWVRDLLEQRRDVVVGVSPTIIDGHALKVGRSTAGPSSDTRCPPRVLDFYKGLSLRDHRRGRRHWAGRRRYAVAASMSWSRPRSWPEPENARDERRGAGAEPNCRVFHLPSVAMVKRVTISIAHVPIRGGLMHRDCRIELPRPRHRDQQPRWCRSRRAVVDFEARGTQRRR